MKIEKSIIKHNENNYTAHFTVTNYYFFGLIHIKKNYFISKPNFRFLYTNNIAIDKYSPFNFDNRNDALNNLNRLIDLYKEINTNAN